jgi:hypothetical protein
MKVNRHRVAALALAMAAGAAAFASSTSGGAGLPAQRGEPLPSSCHATNWGEGEALIRRNAASRHEVVPPGPEELLLCRYWGYGIEQTKETQARAGRLAVERRLHRRSLVRALARHFNRTRPAYGTYSCPFDEGANLYSVFSYADQPNVVVETELSGCGFADNGFGQGGFPPLRLVDRLERLTQGGEPNYPARVP